MLFPDALLAWVLCVSWLYLISQMYWLSGRRCFSRWTAFPGCSSFPEVMIFSDIVISPDGLRSLGCTAFPGCTVPLWLERTEDKLGFLHHRPHSVVPRGRMRSIRQGPNYSVITGLHSLPEWRGVFRGAGIIQTKHGFHCFGLELRVSLPRPLSDSLVLESQCSV